MLCYIIGNKGKESDQKWPLLLLPWRRTKVEEKLKILENRIRPVMEAHDIILDNIEYVFENKHYFLRITLDKVNGIDLDTIVEATNLINPIVDELDLFEESYIMDVISKERSDDYEG